MHAGLLLEALGNSTCSFAAWAAGMPGRMKQQECSHHDKQCV